MSNNIRIIREKYQKINSDVNETYFILSWNWTISVAFQPFWMYNYMFRI